MMKTNKQTNTKSLWLGLCYATLIAVAAFSCKKDSKFATVAQPYSKDLLVLKKTQFNEIYKGLRKTNGEANSQDFKALKRLSPAFISLVNSCNDDQQSETSLQLDILLKKSNAVNFSKAAEKLMAAGPTKPPTTQVLPTYDQVLDQLVDDQAFKAMLNEDGEIQIENTIYKITPLGTFFTTIDKKEALQNTFNQVFTQNEYWLRLYNLTSPVSLANITAESTNDEKIVLLNQSVYFIDTFLEIESNSPITENNNDCQTCLIAPGQNPIITPNPTDPNLPLERQQINYLFKAPQSVLTSTEIDPAYQNMAPYEIEFKKGVGSIIQTFFENSSRYNNFNSDYRMSALMYNRNYGILKTLGIKVKFQKKGWLWWNKENTQEIRAGWDYVAYKSAISIPKISLPNTETPPSTGDPYLINPYENPYYASPMWSTANSIRYNLYGWYMKRGSNELFTIAVPGWLVPFKPEGIDIKSSMFKSAVKSAWQELKKILVKSAPPTGSSIMNSDPNNFKFPVYSLNGDGAVKYLSITDMENMPKSFNSSILREDVLSNDRIQTFVSPYEVTAYNDDKIDIPLDFSTATISISTDPSNIALSAKQITKSLLTSELIENFEVSTASVFGTVKYNNEWRGIRLKVKMKD